MFAKPDEPNAGSSFEVLNMSCFHVEGTNCLVTGANRGLGLALTERLLEEGAAKVYATARDILSIPDLHLRFGSRFVAVELDLTKPKRIEQVARMAQDLNLLVNNAGIALGEDLCPKATFGCARYEMEVNYFGPLQLLTLLSQTLIDNGGAVVNVASVAGLTSDPYHPTYSASKAALHSLTQAARLRLGGKGVSVFGVYPGTTWNRALAGPEPEGRPPIKVVRAILEGMRHGQEDIYPDKDALCFAERYLSAPKECERIAARLIEEPLVVN